MTNQEKLERLQKAQMNLQTQIDTLCLEAKDLEKDKEIDNNTPIDSPMIFTQESQDRLIEIGKQIIDLNAKYDKLSSDLKNTNLEKEKPTLFERFRNYGKKTKESIPAK